MVVVGVLVTGSWGHTDQRWLPAAAALWNAGGKENREHAETRACCCGLLLAPAADVPTRHASRGRPQDLTPHLSLARVVCVSARTGADWDRCTRAGGLLAQHRENVRPET